MQLTDHTVAAHALKQNNRDNKVVILQHTDRAIATKQAANNQGPQPSVAKQVTKKTVKINVGPTADNDDVANAAGEVIFPASYV